MNTLNAGIRLGTCAKLAHGAPWRLSLLHDQEDYILVWLTKGQSLAFVDGTRRGFGANTLIFLPSKTLFSLDLGRTGAGIMLEIPAEKAKLMQLPDRPRVIRLNDVRLQAEMTGHFDNIQRELTSHKVYSEDALDAYCLLLSVFLRRKLAEMPTDPRAKGAHRLTRSFTKLVSSHFMDGMAMAEFAAILDVTPTHLTRACKECSGMTAAEILTERNLYEARALIESTRRPLKDIGAQLGFGSAAYFSRFVQNHTGQSPSAWRKTAVLREEALR